MTLPADIARCPGVEIDEEWREGCEDCQRRTDRSTFPLEHWMAPPEIVAFWCEGYVGPNVGAKATTAAQINDPERHNLSAAVGRP